MASPEYDQLVSVTQTTHRIFRALLGLPPLLLILLWCVFLFRNRRIIAVASKLPTDVPTIPVLGHAHYILYGISGMMMLLIGSAKTALSKGITTACMWLGPYPIIFLAKSEDCQTAINSPKTSEKSGEYKFLRFALGNGLLIAPGHIHRITRKHVHPVFTPRNLEKLMTVFNESSQLLVQDLSQHVGQGLVDVLETVTSAALRNVSCVVFGSDLEIDTKSKDFQGLYKAVNKIAEVECARFVKPWLWPDALFEFLWWKEINEIRKGWMNFANGALKTLEKKKLEEQSHTYSKTTSTSVITEEKSRPLTVPDTYRVLLKNYPQFTEQDLLNELLTLVVTGTDSTKSAISSCLLSLAAKPDVQERLYQEIVTVAGSQESEVTVSDINNMPYLDLVIKETLRKFTVIPGIFREVKEDIQLSDCTVPAGATIGISLISINYDPKVFPDPENFDPDRFSPENVAKMGRHTYIPFSLGSRSCIGKKYAAIFMKTAIIQVLRRYRLSTTVDINNMKFTIALAMVSSQGYFLELAERSS